MRQLVTILETEQAPLPEGGHFHWRFEFFRNLSTGELSVQCYRLEFFRLTGKNLDEDVVADEFLWVQDDCPLIDAAPLPSAPEDLPVWLYKQLEKRGLACHEPPMK